jgi:hypothetical protein
LRPARPTIAILQPGYLPWLGFFDQMRRADVFVYYDDVQYDKHGWRNRNRIKTHQGPLWLSVPVRHSGLGSPRILEVEIDNRTGWGRKHVASLRQAYADAPHASEYLPAIEEIVRRPWQRLVELDIVLADALGSMLGVTAARVRSSELGIAGERSDRLLSICRHFGGGTYLSGDAAKSYLDVELFERHDVAVQWQEFSHPVYPQQHGAFVPYLSALDLLLNCGADSRLILEGRGVPLSTQQAPQG